MKIPRNKFLGIFAGEEIYSQWGLIPRSPLPWGSLGLNLTHNSGSVSVLREEPQRSQRTQRKRGRNVGILLYFLSFSAISVSANQRFVVDNILHFFTGFKELIPF
jgi:hypothetical protein